MSLLNQLFPARAQARLRDFAQARRTRKWVMGIVIFIVLFGLFGFFAVPPLVHHKAEQQLGQLLARPVTIGKISLNPYTLTVEVDQIHIGERDGKGSFVDIGEFLVRGSWTSLFRLKPVIREVFLAKPQVHIIRTDAQTFNFTDLVEQFSKPSPTPKKDSKPTLFSVANIHLDDGLVDFDDRLLGQKHSVDKIELSIPFIANLPSKVDVFAQPMLQAQIDGSPLLIEGKTKPFNGSFNSEVMLKLDQLDLPQLMSYSPTKLPVQLPSGKLSTDLNIQFAMTGEHASVQLSGTIDLKGLALTDTAAQPLFSVDTLHVAAASVEPLLGVVHLSDVRIDHPALNVSRDKQGVLNLTKLAAQSSPTTPTAPKATPAAPAAPGKGAAPGQAAPFDFGLQHLALNDGAVHVQDQQAGASLGLSKLAMTLADISTVAHKPGQYTVQTSLDQGGTIASNGSLTLADGKLDANATIEQLALATFQPYLASALNGRLSQGTASAKLAVKADWSGPAFGLQVGSSEASLDGLRLDPDRAAPKGSPVVALDHISAVIRRIDLGTRNAELSSIAVNGLMVNAERAADGSINLLKLAKTSATPAKPAVAGKQKSATPEQAWKYSIDSIDLDKSGVTFVDRTQKQPILVGLSPLQIKVQHFGSDFSKPLQFDASAAFKRKGILKLGGTATLAPLKVDLQLDGQQMDVAALEPYFTAQLNAYIASALLNIKGELKLASDKNQLKAFYKGDVGLASVRMLDKATSDLFAGWRSLDLTQIKAAYNERGTKLQVGKITLDDFYSRVLLNSNGQLNLSNFVVKENAPTTSLTRASDAAPGTPAPAVAAAPTPAAPVTTAAPALELGFGQILLHRGKVDYSDNFIKPNFSAHLVDIEGDIGAFGTQSTEPARVAVLAKLNDNGPVSINGTINPLVKPPFLDMTATTRDVDLTNFTTYSLKYAGYPIVKGKLNVDLHYLLDHNKLDANNHIFIDQFTFGDHVDSPTATGLPVRLAISLLKNSRGEIDVNVPVSGSLDDPQFSVGGLIWHAFVNLIEKAVTSPFSLLAGAFGGSEELGYVAFEPGSATLSAAEAKKLDTLSKALTDKPGVKLDLTGRVDPALDTPGLKQAAVDRQVKRQKIKDMTGKGESVDIDSITLEPADYDKYLAKAYSAADIKKPRNFVGIAKTIPAADMKKLLLDSTTVSEADLTNLAQQRASVVQQWFAGKIAAGRIFTVAPKMDASGIQDKGPSTRVEFTLK